MRRSTLAQDATTTAIAYDVATRDAQRLAPSLAVERARSNVAASGIGVARILQNPIATVGTTTDGPRLVSNIVVPLPITRRGSAIRAAESSATAAASEIPVSQLDAALATANAWCDLWLAERTLDVARDNERRAGSLRVAADERFNTGSGPRLDVARAAAEHARSRAEVVARTELIAQASAALAYWLGRDPAQPIHVSATPPEAASIPSLATLLARLPSHPLYARSAARTRAAAAGIDVQKSHVWPTLGLQIGTTLWDQNPPTNNVSAGVVFDLPVFNWNGPAIAEARSAAAQVTAESNASTAQLRVDLVSAHAALKAASARAEVAEKEVVPASQVAADLTRDAYRAGAVDLSAVLLADKALADAKQAAFEALAERARALAALEHALGGPL